MTSIRKRGPYQWEARIRKKGMPVTCKTFETKIEAEKWVSIIQAMAFHFLVYYQH